MRELEEVGDMPSKSPQFRVMSAVCRIHRGFSKAGAVQALWFNICSRLATPGLNGVCLQRYWGLAEVSVHGLAPVELSVGSLGHDHCCLGTHSVSVANF